MKKTFKTIALSLLATALASSCSKTGPAGPAGPTGATGATGPNIAGNMEVAVNLYDLSGAKILSGLSGDSLILTNNSTNAVMRAATDNTGRYNFTGLSTGNYNLMVSGTGYGSVLSQNIQFVGGPMYKNVALSVVPTINVASAVAIDTVLTTTSGTTTVSTNYVKIRGYISAPTSGGAQVIVFASNPGSTTASSSVSNYSGYFTATVTPGSSWFRIMVPTSNIYDLGYSSGNQVYFAAYVVGGNLGASSYVDQSTGKTVFNALSSAPVNTFATIQ
ncbi:MAG: carboxypeptidase regulatory-like domain-containing protein [Bacteroidetes bacterium]|nr:carboxypeptidase regulatory-like domain-containing protein [Bacteroidota bacterium]